MCVCESKMYACVRLLECACVCVYSVIMEPVAGGNFEGQHQIPRI